MRQGSPTQNDRKKKDGDRRDQPVAQEARLARGQVKSQATLAHEPFVITGQDKVLSPPATGWLPSAKCLGGVGRVTGQCVRSRCGLDQEATSVFPLTIVVPGPATPHFPAPQEHHVFPLTQ